MKARNEGAFAKFCLPLSKFHLPSDRRQIAATIEEMRTAEAKLDTFWVAVDQYFVKETGKTLNGMIEHKMTSRELSLTSPWSEIPAVPIAKEKESKRADDDELPATMLTSTLEERTARTVLQENTPPSKGKTKVKTRGEATVTLPVHTTEQEASTESGVHPQYRLDKRAYKVFSCLFRLSTKDGVPGELPWNDFVHAMVSISFAVQSLDGSAWIFSPADGTLGRSIIFHEPHPESKIPYLIAKRVGRRLSRAFGWTAENFVRE